MQNKIYNKIIPVLILLQPLFDVITSIMTRLDYKGIIISLMIVYLLFLDKYEKTINYLYILLILIFLNFHICTNLDVVKALPFSYFNYMFKYLYLVLTIFYFIKWFKNGNKIETYQLRVPLLIISLVFILSIVTNTGYLSYDINRRGISGWFNSANEIGSLLCLLFPISIYNAFHSDEKKPIDIFLFISCAIMMIVVGTKTGLFGFLLVMVIYILYRFITIKKFKFNRSLVIAIIIFIIPLLFWKELPAIYNTRVAMDKNNIEDVNSENAKDLFLSGRDDFNKEMQENRENSDIVSNVIGRNYLNSNNAILIVEQDLFDIYYLYGSFGISLLIILFIYLIVGILKYAMKNIKIIVYDIFTVLLLLSVILVLAISFISGHVLLSPSVSTFFALTFVMIYDNCTSKKTNLRKKAIIYMPKLSVGGMEQSLINFLNMSDLKEKCDVELYLGYSIERKYLDSVPKKVKIDLMCKGNWNTFNKLITCFKMLLTYFNLLINPYKYDISICYAYQHGILSKLTRLSSKNNIIFIHNDLLKCRTSEELKKLKRNVSFDKFRKVVCVSDGAKKSFLNIYPNYSGKIMTINNYINGEKILSLSNEEVKDIKKSKNITFINVGRHEEKAKKITRIIESSNKLLKEGYNFRVILIGDGKDHDIYKDLISKYNLDEKILLLGKKVNPYPYYKYSDCFILSSEYEGYGLVLDEARILNIPIISTDVADSSKIMKEGYGILCENSTKGIYNGMKEFLDNGYRLKKHFDYKKFNEEITNKINEFILGD